MKWISAEPGIELALTAANWIQIQRATNWAISPPHRMQLQAREAYPDLPSAYMEKEVLRRYLEGIKDKEAGLNGLVSRFTSLEQAVEHTLLYGESRKALYGARRVFRVCDQESDGEAQVNRVWSPEPRNDNQLDPAQKASGDHLKALLAKLDALYERHTEYLARTARLGRGPDM